MNGQRLLIVVTDPADLAPPGMDPFDPRCTPAWLEDTARASATPIKAWLLDQGQDATRDYAAAELASHGVQARMLIDDSRPTTLKQRYRDEIVALYA